MDSILAMGFAEYQAKKALAETGGNAEAAINYIMVSQPPATPFNFYPRQAARGARTASAPERPR